MGDENSSVRFIRRIDETRNIVLRGRHWYVQDAEQAERLWSLSEGSEDSMADEIERLRQQLAESEARIHELEHDYGQICRRVWDRNGLVEQLAEVGELLIELAMHDIRNRGRWTVGMHARVRGVIGDEKLPQVIR